MTDCCTITVDAVLFDLDGVLVDSTAAVEGHWRDFAVRHGLDAPTLLAGIHGRRMVEIMAWALPSMAVEERLAECARLEAAEVDDARGGTVAQPGAADLVGSLHDGTWAIATSGTRPVALARLDAVGLPVPPALVTGEDVERGKPDPAPYLLAARQLGMDPARCLVVEDAPAGVRAGAAAGSTTVAVTTSHAAVDLAGADHLVGSTADLSVSPTSAGGLVVQVACRVH